MTIFQPIIDFGQVKQSHQPIDLFIDKRLNLKVNPIEFLHGSLKEIKQKISTLMCSIVYRLIL